MTMLDLYLMLTFKSEWNTIKMILLEHDCLQRYGDCLLHCHCEETTSIHSQVIWAVGLSLCVYPHIVNATIIIVAYRHINQKKNLLSFDFHFILFIINRNKW